MKSYSFSEYRKMQEMSNLDRMLGELKKNREQYAKLVFLIAVFTPKVVLATNGTYPNDAVWEILQLGMRFAKAGCIIKGVMNMVNEMLQGANLKEAVSEGGQYFIFYIVLKYYPTLFDMIK